MYLHHSTIESLLESLLNSKDWILRILTGLIKSINLNVHDKLARFIENSYMEISVRLISTNLYSSCVIMDHYLTILFFFILSFFFILLVILNTILLSINIIYNNIDI